MNPSHHLSPENLHPKQKLCIHCTDRPTAYPSSPKSLYLLALFQVCEFACFRKSITVWSCGTLISLFLSLEAFSALMYLNTTQPPPLLQNFWQCILGSFDTSYKSVGLSWLCYIAFFPLWILFFIFSCYTFSDLVLSACFNMLLKPSGEFFKFSCFSIFDLYPFYVCWIISCSPHKHSVIMYQWKKKLEISCW